MTCMCILQNSKNKRLGEGDAQRGRLILQMAGGGMIVR